MYFPNYVDSDLNRGLYFHPLSTSSDVQVAMVHHPMVSSLNFKTQTNCLFLLYIFPMSWLSDFPNEKNVICSKHGTITNFNITEPSLDVNMDIKSNHINS